MLLSLTNITKQYAAVDDDAGGAPPSVLRDVNLSVDAGNSLSIVGPSGSGKSTLLQIIGTLDTPTSGQLLLDGQDLTKQSPDQLALIRNEKIGFIFQSHHLLPQCTVLENVLIPTLVHKKNGDVEARARKLLGRVGLSHRLSHRPGQLSGGECQRVAVVRALINQPKLVLADEPTGALDQKSAETLAELLIEINREEGVTLIVVTHAMPLAQRMGTVYELREGTLVDASQ